MGSAEVDMQNLNSQRATRQSLSFELSRCHCFISGTCLTFVFLQCGIARYLRASRRRFTLDWNAVAAVYLHGHLSSYGRHSLTVFISRHLGKRKTWLALYTK